MPYSRPRVFAGLELNREERILFEGKPQKSFVFKMFVPFLVPVVSIIVSIAFLFLVDSDMRRDIRNIISNSNNGASNPGSWVIFLPFGILVGLALLSRLLEPLRWFHEYYIVTTERVLISKGLYRKKLKELFYSEVGEVTLETDGLLDRPFRVANIYFDRQRLVLMDLEVALATGLHRKLNEIVSNNAINTRLGPPKEEKTLAYHEYPEFEYETDYLDGGSHERIQ
jgi:hypothetical protein